MRTALVEVVLVLSACCSEPAPKVPPSPVCPVTESVDAEMIEDYDDLKRADETPVLDEVPDELLF